MKKTSMGARVIAAIAIALVGALILARVFLFDLFRIPSGSMHPTIPEGSLIVVRKAGYGNYGALGFTPLKLGAWAPIHRGDIIVHQLVVDPGVYYVSRVVGAPGDRIKYENRRLTINGVEAPLVLGDAEGGLQYATETIDGRAVSIAFMPDRYATSADVVVPPDQFFVLGDNRDNARDSRFIGFVPRDRVIGVHWTTISAKTARR